MAAGQDGPLHVVACGLWGSGMSHSGPIVIGFDGSEAAEHAVRAAGELLRGRPALVVSVYKAGIGFELVELPTASIGLPPAPIDVRTAVEVEQELAERAQRLAGHGAELARKAGFEAEGMAVADEVDVPVAETLVNVARERDAVAMVVGAHGHGRLSETLLGSTSRDVIRRAPCPVVVSRVADSD
jgi:nucleotide-binding universal stress UspA family protein